MFEFSWDVFPVAAVISITLTAVAAGLWFVRTLDGIQVRIEKLHDASRALERAVRTTDRSMSEILSRGDNALRFHHAKHNQREVREELSSADKLLTDASRRPRRKLFTLRGTKG